MSWSRFITVENLCIAAEVTAALLLLAFSIPEKRAKVKPSTEDAGNKALLDLAQRAFLEEKIALSLSRLALLDSSRPAVDWSQRDSSAYSDAESLGWLDRLSGTYNRSFVDNFLRRWLALPSENRLGSYLSMVSLKDYTELVRDSGPVQVELMLRDLGSRLKSQFSDQAIVARLPPDRFLVLTFDADPTVGIKCVDSGSMITGEAGAESEAQAKSLELISSVVELSDELPSFEDAVSHLEAGTETAIQIGEKSAFKKGSNWTGDIPAQPAGARKSSSQPNSSAATKSTSSSSKQTEIVKDESSADSSATKLESSELQENDSQLETTSKANSVEELDKLGSDLLDVPLQGKTADVSAVASNEEIAALFAQIKKNENQAGKSQGASIESSSESSESTTQNASVEAASDKIDTDSVSADDIASLFAAAKTPQKPKAQPSVPEAPSNASSDSVASKGAEDSVSADDIASLFAAAKTPQKPKVQPSVPEAPSNAPSDSVASKGAEDSVSADDIASLFAAAKTPQKPKAQPSVPEAPSNAPSDSVASKGAEDSVSADEIASLFATAKPMETAKPDKHRASIADLDSMSETVSTDDISALFKAVQEEKKDNRVTSVKPSPATNNRFAKEIEELSESATSDDIAELFKAVKSGLGAANGAEPANQTTSAKELDENATSEEIADLFATVRRESKVGDVNSKTKGVEPIETKTQEKNVSTVDLQENASSDDIASLFAQLKPNK